MAVKFLVFLAIAVYQVTAQCCGPRPIQVQAQPIVYNQYPNQFVPNIVTNLSPQVVTNLPTPVIDASVVTGYNYNQVVPSCVNPVVPSCVNPVVPSCVNPVVPNAVFATSVVDNSVANSLANALQLLIVSDLIESTLNAKDCPTIIKSVDLSQDYSYPIVSSDLFGCNPCNQFDCPLTAQLTLGYNLPVVGVSVDTGCGCSGYSGCPTTKYYF